MRRYLLVALWPAGMAAIAAATVVAARRVPRPALAAVPAQDPAPAADQAGHADHGASQDDIAEMPGRQADASSSSAAGAAPGRDWIPGLVKLGALSCASGYLSYRVMRSIGPVVVGRGPDFDEPAFDWIARHQVRPWAAIMLRSGKIGDTWTTWGAAGVAGVCLAASWRSQKWLPPSALGAAILVDHYATLALRHRFRRPGPPGSPGGTYPSGGCDRVILFYGMIAQLLWQEFSGSRRAKIWGTGTIAALAFNEAYSRQYLGKHWFTDIVSGLFYGMLLLGPFSLAIRLIAGPASERGGQGRLESARPIAA